MVRSVYSGLVSGVGLLLVAFELRHIVVMQTALGKFIEAAIPLFLALSLVYAGYWLYTGTFDTCSIAKVVVWVVAGMGILALTTIWIISHQLIRGLPFEHAPYVVVNTATVGGVMGFGTGVYDVRGREAAIERATLESEQQKLQFVNSVLRHNVLNSMSVILGQTDCLREQLPAAHHDALYQIETHGQTIVEHVENVRHYTRVVTDEDTEVNLTAVNLSRILTTELETARTTHPDAVVTGDVPADVYVVADELVAVLVENLIANAVQHNDETTPHVTVSLDVHEEIVQLVVCDTGPGIPAARVEEIFAWGTEETRTEATGTGLALANVLVQRYDGNIELEERDPHGTVVTVEFPRARSQASVSPAVPDEGGSE